MRKKKHYLFDESDSDEENIPAGTGDSISEQLNLSK
jgi:hypothetical protein